MSNNVSSSSFNNIIDESFDEFTDIQQLRSRGNAIAMTSHHSIAQHRNNNTGLKPSHQDHTPSSPPLPMSSRTTSPRIDHTSSKKSDPAASIPTAFNTRQSQNALASAKIEPRFTIFDEFHGETAPPIIVTTPQDHHKAAMQQLNNNVVRGKVLQRLSKSRLNLKNSTVHFPYLPSLADFIIHGGVTSPNSASTPQHHNNQGGNTPLHPSVGQRPRRGHPDHPDVLLRAGLNAVQCADSVVSQTIISQLRLWTLSLNAGAKDLDPSPQSSNKHSRELRQSLPQLVPPGMDVYVVAIQEGKGNGVLSIIRDFLLTYYHVHMLPAQPMVEGRGDGSFISTKYTGIFVFVKAHLLPFTTILGQTACSLGLTKGSKGAGCLAIMICGMNFLFLGVHLPANSLSSRTSAIIFLLSNVVPRMFPSLQGFEATNVFQNIFLLGDTNFKMQISDLDALMCVYDQGTHNKQLNLSHPLGDLESHPDVHPVLEPIMYFSSPSSSQLNNTKNNNKNNNNTLAAASSSPKPSTYGNLLLLPAHSMISNDSPSPLATLAHSIAFTSAQFCDLTTALDNQSRILSALDMSNQSFGLQWMYALDELTLLHTQCGILSQFSEPLPGPFFMPSYKRVEGSVLSKPFDVSDIQHAYRTRFKEAWYKGGEVVVRVPAFTDRILFSSQLNAIRPMHFLHALHPSYSSTMSQVNLLPQSDLTDQMVFLNHEVESVDKLAKTYAIAHKSFNMLASTMRLSNYQEYLYDQTSLLLDTAATASSSSLSHSNSSSFSSLHQYPLKSHNHHHHIAENIDFSFRNDQVPAFTLNSADIYPSDVHHTAAAATTATSHLSPDTTNASINFINKPGHVPFSMDIVPQHIKVPFVPETADLYSCIETITFSDHRPVVAGFIVGIPAIATPTIVQAFEMWLIRQQLLLIPPPPPLPPPLQSSIPSNSSQSCVLNSTSQPPPQPPQLEPNPDMYIFPPLPSIRPFSRHNLLWLKPPIQLINKALRYGGSFRFHISCSNLQLIIPTKSSIAAHKAIAQSSLLTSSSTFIGQINESFCHLNSFESQLGFDSSSLCPSYSTLGSNLNSQLSSLPSAMSSLAMGSGAANSCVPLYTPHHITASKMLLLCGLSPISSSQTQTHPQQQTSPSISSHHLPRTEFDSPEVTTPSNSKSTVHVAAHGGAYGSQSSISSKSGLPPLVFPEPPVGPSTCMQSSSYFSGISHHDHEPNTKHRFDPSYDPLPYISEYSYTAHPLNHAKVLFPAPFEHFSFIPRVESLVLAQTENLTSPCLEYPDEASSLPAKKTKKSVAKKLTSIQVSTPARGASAGIQTMHSNINRNSIIPESLPRGSVLPTEAAVLKCPPFEVINTNSANPSTLQYLNIDNTIGSHNPNPTTHSLPVLVIDLPSNTLGKPKSAQKQRGSHLSSTLSTTASSPAAATAVATGQVGSSNAEPSHDAFSSSNTSSSSVLSSSSAAAATLSPPPPSSSSSSTLFGKFSPLQGQHYSTLYGPECSVPVKTYNAHQTNSIQLMFDTLSPLSHGSLRCSFSLNIDDQRLEDIAAAKYIKAADDLVADLPSFSTTEYSTSASLSNSALAGTTTDTDQIAGSTAGSQQHGAAAVTASDHPFTKLPARAQASIQLSLFDFLYSSDFLTHGFLQQCESAGSKTASASTLRPQKPLTIDVPIFHGGTLIQIGGLPVKLRLNINPFYSICEPAAPG